VKRHQVLIAEDDPAVAEALVEIVGDLGHDARVVTTLEQQCAAILEGGFCYMTQDQNMPADARANASPVSGEKGTTFARKWFGRRNAAGMYELPIIAVTSLRDDGEFGMKLARLGADYFIKKPFGEPENVQSRQGIPSSFVPRRAS
jgi:CheY-like chemotaxis protein